MKTYRHETLLKTYIKNIDHFSGRNPDPKYRLRPRLLEIAEDIDELENEEFPTYRSLDWPLGFLLHWHTHNFIPPLYAGNSTNKHLSIFLECMDVHMKLVVADEYENGSKPNTDKWHFNRIVYYPRPQQEIAIFMAFNRWKQAAWLGKQWFSHKGQYFGEWHDTPFNGYMARLHLIHTDKADPCGKFPKLPKLGPYADMFRHWNEPDSLAKAILPACQYHLEQCRAPIKGKEAWMTEFYFPPFDALPLEIVAFRSLREKMGLETPLPRHPLLDTPFMANLPEKVSRFSEPLLDRIVAAVNKHFPNLLK